MKILKTGTAIVIAMSLLIGAAQADNSLKQGAMSLSVPVNEEFFIVTGKYMTSNDLAILGGIGLGINGGDADGTDIALEVGMRKYMRTTDFAPFMGGTFGYSSTDDSNVKSMAILAEFGAEYFLNRQFSIEGLARAGYGSTEVGNIKVSRIGSFGTRLSVNFYF